MKYEKTPIKKLIRRKAIAKLTTDMSKLSTLNVLRYLYRRHDTNIWITLFWLQLAGLIWFKLGR